jgi:RNA-binding protein
MEPLSGKQLRKLKSLAHHLKPIVFIGKLGVTDSLVEALDQALAAHELVKVKFIGFKDEKKALIEVVSERTGAAPVALVGNIATLYRQCDDPAKRRIVV